MNETYIIILVTILVLLIISVVYVGHRRMEKMQIYLNQNTNDMKALQNKVYDLLIKQDNIPVYNNLKSNNQSSYNNNQVIVEDIDEDNLSTDDEQTGEFTGGGILQEITPQAVIHANKLNDVDNEDGSASDEISEGDNNKDSSGDDSEEDIDEGNGTNSDEDKLDDDTFDEGDSVPDEEETLIQTTIQSNNIEIDSKVDNVINKIFNTNNTTLEIDNKLDVSDLDESGEKLDVLKMLDNVVNEKQSYVNKDIVIEDVINSKPQHPLTAAKGHSLGHIEEHDGAQFKVVAGPRKSKRWHLVK
jgi:hypothetical protein